MDNAIYYPLIATKKVFWAESLASIAHGECVLIEHQIYGRKFFIPYMVIRIGADSLSARPWDVNAFGSKEILLWKPTGAVLNDEKAGDRFTHIINTPKPDGIGMFTDETEPALTHMEHGIALTRHLYRLAGGITHDIDADLITDLTNALQSVTTKQKRI